MIESGKLNLEQLVESLLWQHDCVILPNLGALITRENQAAINPATHIFKPKSKSIFFNPSISKTDGLLANHLSENFGIGYNDAVLMIDQAVNDIKTEIHNGSKVKWESVGHFFGANDKTFFIPKAEANFLKETYGLLPVQLIPIAQKSTHKVVTEQLIEEPVTSLVTERVVAPISNREEEIDYNKTALQPELDKPVPLPANKPMIKYLRWVAAAIVIAALTIIGLRNENRTYFTEQKAAIDFNLTDKGEIELNEPTTTTEDYQTEEETPEVIVNNENANEVETVVPAIEEQITPEPTVLVSTETLLPTLKHNLNDQYHIVIEKTVLKASIDPLLFELKSSYYLPIRNSFIHRVALASSNDARELKEILESLKYQYPKAEIIDKVAYEKL